MYWQQHKQSTTTTSATTTSPKISVSCFESVQLQLGHRDQGPTEQAPIGREYREQSYQSYRIKQSNQQPEPINRQRPVDSPTAKTTIS